MFRKKKPDPEPNAMDELDYDGYDSLPVDQQPWKMMGYATEAASIEDFRVRMAKAKQRQEQHDYNREVLYRMGFRDD